MSEATPGETAKVIRDLLVVAKVAMPPSLYAQDPRVAAATTMLRSLEQGISAHRPPNSSDRPPDFDVAALALSRPVEESKYGISFVVDLSWDLVEASAQALAADTSYPLDPGDAVDYVLRDWFTSHGYGKLLPMGDDVPN